LRKDNIHPHISLTEGEGNKKKRPKGASALEWAAHSRMSEAPGLISRKAYGKAQTKAFTLLQ